ncbi:protein kinase [Candidatus Uabimicrobium sp. HlEnr_7]|uniref:protein kinase domain-containing protein n=1 Tax=Candidatus Uabimicrobium helgolandensis TaxID=3095367 RepID=UPI0035581907
MKDLEKMYAISGRISIKKGDILAGKYQYVKKLGMGGMGAVCLVSDIKTQQLLAMKYCLSEDHMDRFEREVLAWLQLGHHPNIVSAIYFDRINNKPTLFIEYVKGSVLKEVIKQSQKEREELYLEKVLDYAIQICRGMDHLHEKGIIHRDLNPKNIIIQEEEGRFGVVKITDFGLSKLKVLPRKSKSTKMSGRHLVSKIELTETNQVLGTPQYMSPQQYTSSKEVNESTDIYAFGLILYEMISCGKFPFEANSTTGWLHAHLYRTPRHIKKQSVVKISLFNHKTRNELYELVMKCLAKTNKERPGNFAEIEKQLETIYEQLCKKSYRRSKISASVLSKWEEENNKAVSLLKIGSEHVKEATSILSYIHKESPDYLYAHLNLLLLQLKTKSFSLEEFWLEANQVLQETSDTSKVIEIMVGGALEKRTNMQKSLQLLEQVQDIENFPSLARKKAKWLFLKGEFSKALKLFEMLCEKDHATVDDFYNRVGAMIYCEIRKDTCQIVPKADKFSLVIPQELRQKAWNILRLGEKKCGVNDALERAKDIIAGGEVPKTPFWHEYGQLKGHKKSINKIIITPNNRNVVSVGEDRCVKVWDVANKKLIYELRLDVDITSIAVTPDAYQAALGLKNGEIHLYSLQKKTLQKKIVAHKSMIVGLSFCYNESKLISCDGKGEIKHWDLRELVKKKKLWHLRGEKPEKKYSMQTELSTLGVNLSGSLVIAGGSDGNIYFLPKKQQKNLSKINAHTREINKILISANEKIAVSMCKFPPHNLILWNLRNQGKIHFSLENITSIAITGDAKYILVGTEEGFIDVWNAIKKIKLLRIEAHNNSICDMAITADAKMAVSGASNGAITLWANNYVWPIQLEQHYLKSSGI